MDDLLFQQYGVSAHTTRGSLEYIWQIFRQHAFAIFFLTHTHRICQTLQITGTQIYYFLKNGRNTSESDAQLSRKVA